MGSGETNEAAAVAVAASVKARVFKAVSINISGEIMASDVVVAAVVVAAIVAIVVLEGGWNANGHGDAHDERAPL
jgi:succinyl-CoA synthetase beta subunit